jgi:hypothetical protein
MKRIHWWTLLGVSGTGLAALLLGQTVLGQPEGKGTMPLPLPPSVITLPEIPAVRVLEGKSEQPSQLPPITQSGPVFRDSPAAPIAPALQPATQVFPATTVQSSPLTSARTDKQITGNLTFEVQPGKQQPAVSIEWGGPTSIRINQPLACQIVVRNTSTTPTQNVVVRHRLGQGVTCKTTEPVAGNDNGELVWNLGTLAPDQSRRIDLTLVTPTRGPLNCHATVTFTAVAAHQVQVREPLLAVKMRGPDKVIAGENVTLNFVVSNPGDGIAEAIKLKTVLPDGLEHPRGKVVEFDVGNLAPKEVRNLQLICLSKGSGLQKCSITVNGDGGLVSTDATQVEILMPKLDVAMSGPKLRYLDRHAVYVLKVTNPGSAPVNSIEVQELIPSGFKFHQANNGGQYQEATRLVSWTVGELQPGESKDIAVDLIPIEAGEHRLIARAQAARGLKSEAEIRTMVEGLPSLFIEVGHIDDPLEVGAETAYEIRLANTGTKMETNVEVVCTLPEQLEFRGAKCSTSLKYRQEGRELIFEALPRLAPKADVIYRVQVRGVAPGDIRFRTRIKADGLKEPVLREESTRIYSDGDAAKPASSTPSAITPVPTPMPITSIPTPSVSVPAPFYGAISQAPELKASIPTPSVSVPAPPSVSVPTPTPSPLPMPSDSKPERTPTPLPLPTPTIPTPTKDIDVPTPTPAPSSVPLPTPIPLPMPSVPSIPLPIAPAPLPAPSLPSSTVPVPATQPAPLPIPIPIPGRPMNP